MKNYELQIHATLLEAIAKEVYGVAELTGSRRIKEVWARMAVFVSLRNAGGSMHAIGGLFGKDHSTVVHAIKKHEDFIQIDKDYQAKYNEFLNIMNRTTSLEDIWLTATRYRINEINKTLQGLGHDWHFIENFWKDCINQAKQAS